MAMLGSMLLSTTASLVGAFMPEYWSYLVLRFFLQSFFKTMITMMMTRMMTMMMTMMMIRFLTAVGAVGLFNEAFTLTVEVMGAKEVSDDDDDEDGYDDDDDDDIK